jgi:hypothetical protein
MNARVVRPTELVSRSAVSCSCPLDDVCKADRQGTSVRPAEAILFRSMEPKEFGNVATGPAVAPVAVARLSHAG